MPCATELFLSISPWAALCGESAFLSPTRGPAAEWEERALESQRLACILPFQLVAECPQVNGFMSLSRSVLTYII